MMPLNPSASPYSTHRPIKLLACLFFAAVSASAQQKRDALQKAGAEATLQTLPGAGHGDGAFAKRESFEAVREFFARHLKK